MILPAVLFKRALFFKKVGFIVFIQVSLIKAPVS
jgi:hypothetical protein